MKMIEKSTEQAPAVVNISAPATISSPASNWTTGFLLVDPVIAAELPPAALRAQLEELVNELANRERIEISGREQARIAEELAHDMVGYGPLEVLLNDDSINDIMVNGPDRTFVEVRGKVMMAAIRFRNAQQVAAIEAVKLAVEESGSWDGDKLAEAFTNFKDVPLLVGPTTFTPELHVNVERPQRVLEVKDGALAWLETRAPEQVVL